MEITILEGARGTGKTTLAQKLRQTTSNSTLINFTGFNQDGEEGLRRVTDYYKAFMGMFLRLAKHDSKFIFDRFFFSEMVYSQLYKDYDFEDVYKELLFDLEVLAHHGAKINILYLTVNEKEELKRRLIRDKVSFFNVDENVEETMKQQNVYKDVFDDLFTKHLMNNDAVHKNLHIKLIDTSHKTNEEVYNDILKATN